ncbi:iron complex transport system permease protein [Halanaerobium saccharolyticum]|uniref:Iron complex transport system permease protein n=1 Tax=Halanaerobium saccharolyticum TaxID=43595 RepID=A0A4R7YRX8_9FIRM|nr:iron ABC transporter permease [Halanaerobium saccharolyticum]RAK10259.1 iron complex transport system permease protein [Halanaerobium saccharolyticum]TDW00471.1 iron complex transport system permease protein [Halanaerobium saccharolyticum]TDX52056.1 iron complex transport system permease protein [Halanaerobium saccharolyticum]
MKFDLKKNKVNSLSFSFILLASLLILVASFFLAVVFGAAEISAAQVWQALTASGTGDDILIIQEIRLPRAVAAVVVGAALAVAGAIMQGMTRNPLADPGLFGLTAGANAALALAIALFPALNYFGNILASFIGAAVGAGLVFGISSLNKKGFSPFRIVLAGSAVSTFLYALAKGISLYFQISKNVSMWTAGGLVGISWTQLKLIIPFVLVGLAATFFLSRQLTILSLKEEIAVGLGQNIFRIKVFLFIIIIVLTGASVALVGNIVFLGLMIPHIVRAAVGRDYRFVLPLSALSGSAFMLLADLLARTINAPYETPVVAVVAMLGLPFFLIIVNKRRRDFA